MKLKDLDARFIICKAIASTERDEDGKYVWRGDDNEIYFWSTTPERYVFERTTDIAQAHGLWFDCPMCKGKEHEHSVLVGFAGRSSPNPVSRGSNGKPSNWNVSGTSLDDLVLTPSIQLHGGCNWHGFVGSSGVPPGEAA